MTKQINEATEIKVLRRIVDETRRNHSMNSEIRNWCGIQSINDWIRV